MLTAVTTPPVTLAVAVALLPPPPVNVTVGGARVTRATVGHGHGAHGQHRPDRTSCVRELLLRRDGFPPPVALRHGGPVNIRTGRRDDIPKKIPRNPRRKTP